VPHSLFEPLLLSVVGLSIVLGLWGVFRSREPNVRARATARLAYRRTILLSTDPRYSFNGRTAEVLSEQEDVPDPEHSLNEVTLHVHARNAHGEYFFVVAPSSGGVFAKHISHAAAKAVLGEKYVAPV
jgi:hypothetical protein